MLVIFLSVTDKLHNKYPLEDEMYSPEQLAGNDHMGSTVIIYARERTGSTFTSEYFNRHQHGFYIFEPLQYVSLQISQKYGLDIIKDFLQCRVHFSVRNKTYPNNPKFHDRNWTRDRFCTIDKPRLCDDFSVSRMESLCRKSAIRAAKVIRLHSLHRLNDFVRQGTRVLIVLRDPRGMMASRVRTAAFRFPEWKPNLVHNDAGWYCYSMLRDVDFIDSLTREQQSSYLVVRYEDLATQPMRALKKMYRFLGIKPDLSVTNWALNLAKYNPAANETDNGTLRKNVSASTQLWRAQLNNTLVQEVQTACNTFMNRFGYLLVNSTEELSDYSKSLLAQGYLWHKCHTFCNKTFKNLIALFLYPLTPTLFLSLCSAIYFYLPISHPLYLSCMIVSMLRGREWNNEGYLRQSAT